MNTAATFAIDIAVAKPQQLPDCLPVFADSPLHRNYFADGDRLERSLGAAIEKKQLLVALCPSGEIIGAMQVDFTGFFGVFPYLALLGVKAGWRGKGVGHFLLEAYEEMARTLGYGKVSMMVSHFNPRAKKLYQSMGYRKIGYLEDAILPGIHENIMVKTIS